jgi:hypothetical protein
MTDERRKYERVPLLIEVLWEAQQAGNTKPARLTSAKADVSLIPWDRLQSERWLISSCAYPRATG